MDSDNIIYSNIKDHSSAADGINVIDSSNANGDENNEYGDHSSQSNIDTDTNDLASGSAGSYQEQSLGLMQEQLNVLQENMRSLDSSLQQRDRTLKSMVDDYFVSFFYDVC